MEFLITDEDAGGMRLDRFLAAQLPECSRSRIQSLIKDGHILFNGGRSKPRQPVSPGDTVLVELPEPTPASVSPQEIPLSVLFEDEDLVVIDKACGMVVHPGPGNPSGTLVNALLHHCENLSGVGGVLRPGIVHRLDKDTSGCLVVAKHDAAHRALSAQFSGRTVSKTYLAVVAGRPRENRGRIENRIARHPVNRMKMAVVAAPAGRVAVTEFEVLHALEHVSLVRCDLHTGRTHQIRVHMKSLGAPILGDEIYARPEKQKVPVTRMMLHAWKLGFTHPRSEEPLDFVAPIPEEFAPFLPEDIKA